MTTTRVLIVFACFVAVSFGWKIGVGETYFPDCSAQPATYCKRENCSIWYLDPVGGSADGDGTSAKPWNSMNSVLTNLRCKMIGRDVYTGPIPIPDDLYNKLPDRNPNGVILPGDVIVLRGGDYPMIDIRNYILNVPITFMGEPGARPVIDRLLLAGTTNFIWTCLNFTSSDTSNFENFVVYFTNIGYMGAPSYYNVFTKNTIFCYPDINVFKGKPQEEIFKASIGGFGTRASIYTEVSHNYLYNLKRGFLAWSEYTTMRYNVINYFIGDGFRVLHNNTIVEHNLVMNSMNVDNNGDHRDGVQFFTNGNQLTLANITISSNIFICDVDKNRPFFSGFQGISSFDVASTNVTIENNLIVTMWNWHGIALLKASNSRIIGNTLVDVSGNRTFYPWITTKLGSSGIVVQNNIAHAFAELDGVTTMNSNMIKHWTVQELADLFVDPQAFNMRLKDNGSNPFIGTGNSTDASIYDNDGNIRGGDRDVGCYAYHPLDPNTNAPTVGNAPRSDGVSDTPQGSVQIGTPSVTSTMLVSKDLIVFLAFIVNLVLSN